ncbi:DNA cytosine methyltransferase [Streptococcus dentasini]
MKFLDLFSGIGGFRLGMEAAGHTCLGFCEIDKFARASYKAIYDTKGEIELHDIRRVSDDIIQGLRGVDIVCGGFPCQAFSLAGNRRGFEDTRGTLFFEIARFASLLRPQYLFLENVRGLLSHDRGLTFETMLRTLDQLGYDVEWQVLNSAHFGVPQDRRRIYIIGHLRGAGTRPIFPLGDSDTEAQKFQGQEAVTNTLNARYYEAQRNGSYIVEGQQPQVIGNIHPSGRGMNGKVYQTNGLAPTITTNKGEGVKIIQRSHGYNKGGDHDLAPTLTSNSYQENNYLKIYDLHNQSEKEMIGTLTANGHSGSTSVGTFGIEQGARIRKLTPRECWRLQGFPDWAFDRAQAVNSNSQLYKQAGNSVTVPVIQAIAERLV